MVICLCATIVTPPGGIITTNPACIHFMNKLSVSAVLSLNCLPADMTAWYDSHGGFHGDGTTFYRLEFPDDSAVDSIKKNKNWKELPLTDNLTTLAGFIERDNDWGNPLIPQVENGYYCFIDRHSESRDKKDDTDVLNRCSYNFTIAVYDTDSNILYYGEEDT